MDLKVTLLRRGLQAMDIQVTFDPDVTIGAVAEAIRRCEPERSLHFITGAVTLQLVTGRVAETLDPSAVAADSPLRSGSLVTVVAAGDGTNHEQPRIGTLEVLTGVDEGAEIPLRQGSTDLGRSSACGIVLRDPLVSAEHARLMVGDQIEILDLNSSNGVLVGGELASRAVLQDGDSFTVGSTSIRVALDPGVRLKARQGAVVEFPRSPFLDPHFEGREEPLPQVPEEPPPPRPPVIPLLVPLLMGGVLFAVTRSALSVIFIAMMPLLMLGTFIESSLAGKRNFRRQATKFRTDLAELEQRLLDSGATEQAMRRAEQPGSQECLEAASALTPLLWSRRPDTDSFLKVRLGLARQPSRTVLKLAGGERGASDLRAEAEFLMTRFRDVPDVPVVGDFRSAGNLGFAVGDGAGVPVAVSTVMQLTALHAPGEMLIVGLTSVQSSARWEWLKWTPHVSESSRMLGAPTLASTGPGCQAVVRALEELLSSRRQQTASASTASSEIPRRPVDPRQVPAVIVVLEGDAPADRPALVRLAEEGPDVGIHLVWVAPRVDLLPAACRVYVDATGPEATFAAGFVHGGIELTPLDAEATSSVDAERFARGLSPVVDASASIDEAAGLPASVSFVEAAGYELAESPDYVVERWRESGSLPMEAAGSPGRLGTLRAWVGAAAGESLYLDLRSQGPHALVGGTTGSGKSEFLQTWIVGMATAHSPARVNFLFVDYKGGSAFADCVKLPHTVGLVTDLSPHLVSRALASLNAELRFREHILNRKHAKDLAELERRGDPETPPSLVIVIDEFAALVQEVPAFVDGVINVAQRGRSLGLHLIMATQRPAGVIKDNLRANTNLRVALRMADEADSTDVVGAPTAAMFSPDIPGRALAKLGPGRLTPFQAGYVGGWTSREPAAPSIAIRALSVGAGTPWPEPPTASVREVTNLGPTDLQRLVATVSEASAAARIPEVRKPWLPELAHVYDLAALPSPRTDDVLVFAVGDVPERQEQPLVSFLPDRDGSIAVFGTGGSGKSAFLRSIAVAAGITPRGGPCDVYAIDGGGRALSMLETLPHVGSVISVDDEERVERLITFLSKMIAERSKRYADAGAGSITEYRRLASSPEEARILLLVDNFGSFRQNYEIGNQRILDRLLAIASEGRQAGVHVIVSADRPGAIPSALSASIQRRLVLRMASETDEAMLSVPRGILDPDSPPGRGIWGETEVQVAVIGGSSNIAQQTDAISRLAEAMTRSGRRPAPPVARLEEHIPLSGLPVECSGLPTIGVEASSLSPIGFVPEGVFLISGPPQSGRTQTVRALVESLRRRDSEACFYFMGSPRSLLLEWDGWTETARDVDQVVALAEAVQTQMTERPDSSEPGRPSTVVVVESVSEWATTPAEAPLTDLIKAARMTGNFVVAEGETTTVTSGYGFMQVVKSDRAGLALQPDQADGELVFKTPFPRVARRDFPPGRGLLVRGGRSARVQVVEALR
jgi:S-DNA-T family DNA segregation ATPase FtsK/SpoIIIE